MEIILLFDSAVHSVLREDCHHLSHTDHGKFSGLAERCLPFLYRFTASTILPRVTMSRTDLANRFSVPW